MGRSWRLTLSGDLHTYMEGTCGAPRPVVFFSCFFTTKVFSSSFYGHYMAVLCVAIFCMATTGRPLCNTRPTNPHGASPTVGFWQITFNEALEGSRARHFHCTQSVVLFNSVGNVAPEHDATVSHAKSPHVSSAQG